MRKLFFITATLLVSISIFGQIPQKLPLDSKVRSGVLENGLTYFIVKNAEPKGQAEFFIAQKVGAIQEEENQRGLAHFLEHMAFNGTKNFPGNKVISYLEKIGVKFGENLNAYTAIDQTVYNISAVPAQTDTVIDACLLILHDWACAINLLEEDIDKERGVIREELRTTSNARMRMFEALLPELMPGSKYAHRLPAGLVEVINTFTYDELRAYYKKWYRPDLQGIVIAGDIDPDAVEKKVKKLFGAIPAPVNPAIRREYEVPDNKEPLIAVASDKEAQSTNIMLMYKHDPLPAEHRATASINAYDYLNTMTVSILNERLSEIAQKPGAPFLGASSYYDLFLTSQTKDAFTIGAISREDGIADAFKSITTEAERVKRFGFTSSEYERAKANYLSEIERAYKEKDKRSSSDYVEEILNHFLTGDAMPGIEIDYSISQQLASVITLEQLNSYANSLITDNNVVVAVMMPKKDGVEEPGKELLLKIYEETKKSEIEAYKEKITNEPLISKTPVAGKILSESPEPISNGVVWILSNGATVVVKQTDFKEDQILFNAVSRGGLSLVDVKEVISSKIASNVISIGGLGNFSPTDLNKVLAGKNVSFKNTISLSSESISGNSSPKDIEIFLQLIYLNFIDIRTDEEAYQAFLERYRVGLKNSETNPGTTFSDSLQANLYNRNPYIKRLTADDTDHLDYKTAIQIFKERHANAADFTFIFVGNINPDILKPLVETYIASLPGNKSKREDWRNIGLSPIKGVVKKEFGREMETPKSTVNVVYTGEIEYTLENILMADIIRQIFDQLFTRTIREDEQGTYGVGVDMTLSLYPYENYTFVYGFDTDVTLTERLLARAKKEIEGVIENGVETEDFNKVIEFMNKNYAQNLRENNYWLSIITGRYLSGKDLQTDYESTLKSITPDKVNSFIKKILLQGNRYEQIMNGYKK